MNSETLLRLHTDIVEKLGESPNLSLVISVYQELTSPLFSAYEIYVSQYKRALETLESPKINKVC
jgi:hypothetical protein